VSSEFLKGRLKTGALKLWKEFGKFTMRSGGKLDIAVLRRSLLSWKVSCRSVARVKAIRWNI